MKLFSQCIAIFLFVFLVASDKTMAQDEQPLLVVSFNQVLMSDVGKVNKMVDSIFVPVLKELVDEGLLFSFGFFGHAWGDEWNSNVWYTVKDMTSFEKFWDEYVNRINTRHAGSFAAATKYFQAHKDNIYSVRTQYPAPTN